MLIFIYIIILQIINEDIPSYYQGHGYISCKTVSAFARNSFSLSAKIQYRTVMGLRKSGKQYKNYISGRKFKIFTFRFVISQNTAKIEWILGFGFSPATYFIPRC